MVRVIMGAKGSGKTKQMVELINYAAENEIGSVVCIELGRKMMFDISRNVRLVEAGEFPFGGYEFLKGFIGGLYASNYDLTHVFIDSLCKIIPSEPDSPEVEEFLAWLSKFAEKNNIKFTITISADVALATEAMKEYF